MDVLWLYAVTCLTTNIQGGSPHLNLRVGRWLEAHQAQQNPFISILESFSEEDLTFKLMHENMLARDLQSNSYLLTLDG